MFTGLVETLASVQSVEPAPPGVDLAVVAPFAQQVELGASVAINGVCLTVVRVAGDLLHFQAGPETLGLTNLGELKPGDRVNLERSLRLGDAIGGHLVQGHVDGMGRIERRDRQGEWEMIWFRCAPELTRQMVRKGSITVDGISLTLVDVEAETFSVALIPHTLAVTTLGFKQPGATVNLETDLFAKYIEKYLERLSLGPRG